MKNKTQGGKKVSPNTKTSNTKQNNRNGRAGGRQEQTERTEEKTAVTVPKSKVIPPKNARKSASTTSSAAAPLKNTKSVTSTVDKCPTMASDKKEKKKKEKWSGDEAAAVFSKTLATVNVNSQYDDIQKMPVQNERCKIWESHAARNRHPDYKCYDDIRVIVQMCKSDYINGTKVNVPNFTPSVYLVQIPKLESVDAVEEFWRMVFQEQCQSLHIIARPEELTNPGLEKLFAQETGAYLYANGFFVNTRKVEKRDAQKPDQFVVELLPEGCSNSVMCSVYLHTYWKPFSGPDRFAAQIRAAQQIAKNENNGNAPTIIASVRGAGRNAALLSLAVVVDQLNKGKEPKIHEIVRSIREQRPMAVDSLPQYVSLYLATNWLIKAKLSAGPGSDDTLARMKKFNDKAKQTMPASMMKQPTEEAV